MNQGVVSGNIVRIIFQGVDENKEPVILFVIGSPYYDQPRNGETKGSRKIDYIISKAYGVKYAEQLTKYLGVGASAIFHGRMSSSNDKKKKYQLFFQITYIEFPPKPKSPMDMAEHTTNFNSMWDLG